MNFKEQFTTYLEQLRKSDSENSIFGSGSHKYTFGSKLSDSEISVFEKEHNCALPESYKTYLTEFGNGGGGPSYGVFPLGEMDAGFKVEPWPSFINPAATFRFTESYNNEEIIYVGELRQEDFPTTQEYEKALEIWWDEIGENNLDRYYEEHSLDGAIPICHHGCGSRSWLVVDEKNPEFGNVWDCFVADQGGVAPSLKKDGSRVSFADWILDWCVESLRKL